ncbi:hypothetical protein DER45DRAFT_620092 [Fusarium avenaceum]|nr:hypothetical protein DER45DRAFT_620092 [Fusarium avenaceum]
MLLWPLQMTKLFVQGSEYFKDIFSANSTVSYSIVNPLKTTATVMAAVIVMLAGHATVGMLAFFVAK